VAKVEVVGTTVGRTAEGCELRIRSPWYRSLPLSSVLIELTLDGETVEPDRMRFCVNERDYTFDELAERYEEFWFVLDPGRLRVRGVQPGEHEIDLRLGLRIPYLFDEETGAVHTIHNRVQRTVVVPEEPQA
jgi:hypothetical protein